MKLSITAFALAGTGAALAAAAMRLGEKGRYGACASFCVLLVLAAVTFWRLVIRPIRGMERTVDMLEKGTLRGDGREGMVDTRLAALLSRMQHALQEEYSTQMLKKQAELSALQSQINPHFLYNTLESIRGQALIEGMDEIADMIEALSLFFRYSISNTGSTATLEEELDNVRNYMKIQQFRFGDRVSLEVRVPAEELLNCALPKMTLQPIVENAVQHGMENVKGKGVITVIVLADELYVEVRVADNGVGMRDEEAAHINESLDHPVEIKRAQEGHTGIALTNVSQRIKLRYGEEYGLHVFSTLGVGTEVAVLLPRGDAGGRKAWKE